VDKVGRGEVCAVRGAGSGRQIFEFETKDPSFRTRFLCLRRRRLSRLTRTILASIVRAFVLAPYSFRAIRGGLAADAITSAPAREP